MTALCSVALAATVDAHTFDEMTYTKAMTTFRLNALGKAREVKVHLYNEGVGGSPVKTIRLKRTGIDVWTGTAKGDWMGKFYTFQVRMPDQLLAETPGVFAKAVGVNGHRAAIIDLNATNPDGWENDRRPPLKSPTDLVIYEMHHRDFSVSPSSGLQNKGKFLALTEPKAVCYLRTLGVNAVHILPSFDFASIDEGHPDKKQYNWGYDPLNYNVPEGSYATDACRPDVRIREFKTMVQSLHKAGIRVILDVVYNHTFDINGSNFQLSYPDYYYRKTSAGEYSNGSGCGNETASEKPLMRQFMLASVKYWIDEYHIDGFRFDLMGVHDIETMTAIRQAVDTIDPSIYIYGEGWSAGSCAYPQDSLAMKANTAQLNGVGAFCDDMRDALRGPFSDDTKGAFLAGIGGNEESIKFGIAGCISHPDVDMSQVNYSKQPWAAQPSQMISYVSCHDDMCLTDRLRASIPGIGIDELIRLDLLAQTAVFTSQGVPFMLSGEEMLRDKKGIHNSYNSPDSINALNWRNLDRFPQVFDYYRSLIELRRNHPAFRMGDTEQVRKHLSFLPSADGIVAFVLKNHAGGDNWRNIIVVLNANNSPQKVEIPQGDYTIVADNGIINAMGMGEVHGTVAKVAAQCALIIHD